MQWTSGSGCSGAGGHGCSSSLLACCLAVATLTLCASVAVVTADDVILPSTMERQELDRLYDPRRKKPFCNAFTGCGKKRSDESMATLVDLNSEPAVADLSRQILSEAKLWEAIQEARDELLRREHDKMAALQTNQLSPRQLQLGAFRKRRSARSVDPSEFARRLAGDAMGRYY